jgi:hypothetical protein
MKGEAMSKQTRHFMEQVKSGQEPSLAENIKDAASLLKNIGGQVWDEAKPMVDHGRSEIASFLFGDHRGHVVYMRGQEGQGQAQEQAKEMPEDQRDLGREM